MAIIDINNLSKALESFYSKIKNNFAPTSHASTATTYGVSSASNYGHAMASKTTPKANGTAAVGSETAKFARGDHVHPLQTTVSGNAGTANKFASAQSITLTGDVTGSASSQAGWSIATTLKNSGVTAGSYGPSANASPAHKGTFSVPYITVDAKGRITEASTKTITLPADNNTDTKVTYTLGTTTKYYMGGPTATATGTGGITFDTGIYATTTSGQLSVGSLQTRGHITTSGNGTHDLGSTSNRFKGVIAANVYSYDKNAKPYASLRMLTEGTADTQGVGRLTAGNNVNAGTAGNAKGQVVLFGTNTGYTTITPGYNSTSNVTVTLPSATGTVPIMSKGDGSYWGMLAPDGGTSWIRTTSSGLIPVDQNGTSALGTSSWPFGNIYGTTIYEGGKTLSSKYAAKSHGTHLTIGTGASNAAAGNHSHNSFNIKGDNTITSTANDTTAKWGAHGNSVHWYTATGQLIDQPNQYGYILNIGKTSEVHQIWMTQSSGDMFHRGGNASGWSGSWRKLLDSSNWSSYAAPASHNHTQLTGEVRFTGSGTYKDPWNGTECAIKASGNIGCTGGLRANGGVATCGAPCGAATTDGATYVANLRYDNNRGFCDLGSNSIPGRLGIRSGQGTAGSGVYIECKVTDGKAYMQYLSPEAGTIALTKHLSDRTRKDNIVYIDSEESKFTTKDFYDFIRDDLGLATYTLKENYASTDTHIKLNFIAQDILWDYNKNEEHKVGNLIVQAASAMEEQLSLKFDPDNYVSVIAGALKESINKIEELESKNKILEELVYSMNERLLKIESCSKEE